MPPLPPTSLPIHNVHYCFFLPFLDPLRYWCSASVDGVGGPSSSWRSQIVSKVVFLAAIFLCDYLSPSIFASASVHTVSLYNSFPQSNLMLKEKNKKDSFIGDCTQTLKRLGSAALFSLYFKSDTCYKRRDIVFTVRNNIMV